MIKDFSKIIDVIQNDNTPNYDTAENNEKQVNDLYGLFLSINAAKEVHKTTINSAKELVDKNLKLFNYIKGERRKREIGKYKRRMQKHWKKVKDSDIDMMKAANDLLELMKMYNVESAICNDGRSGSNTRDLTLFENMGFSKNDGFSEDPSGKIDIVYQMHVFDLIKSLLDLHNAIMSFVFHQTDIVDILSDDLYHKNIKIFFLLSGLFPQELTRQQCLEIIKKVFEENGVTNYSESYIKKQLSNWNVYQPTGNKKTKRKNTKPLAGYESAKKKTEKEFEEWVKNVYFHYYTNMKRHRSISSKKTVLYNDNRSNKDNTGDTKNNTIEKLIDKMDNDQSFQD